MTIEVSAFRWVPPFAQGYVRNLWVRWALEEAGLPYEAVLIDPAIQASTTYRSWQPFGQVPAYRDGEVELFESGAIVLHVASKSEALAPRDEASRARITTWVPGRDEFGRPARPVFSRTRPRCRGGENSAAPRSRRASRHVSPRSRSRSAKGPISKQVFSAGDVMMVGVLRELVDSGLLRAYPNLDAYRERCEARPAFSRALEAQMKVFRDNAPE